MPDDNVGWDWSDLDLLEAGQAKYNSVLTQSWQKEVDVSSGGKLSVLKSRMTQVWDASLASGNSSMLHATSQEVSNMNYPSNAGPHHVSSLEARETLLKSFGRAGYPVANMGVQFGSGQMFSDPQQQQGKSRNQGVNPGNNQLFHNSSVSGGMPMNEYINFINDRHQRSIVPPAHQLLGGGKTTNGPHYPPNRWDDGQEPPRLKEKESSLSSFELRLGQPSQQQTQPAGDSFVASLASLPASAVERHKALLFDQVVQRGTLWNNSFCPQNDQASKSSLFWFTIFPSSFLFGFFFSPPFCSFLCSCFLSGFLGLLFLLGFVKVAWLSLLITASMLGREKRGTPRNICKIGSFSQRPLLELFSYPDFDWFWQCWMPGCSKTYRIQLPEDFLILLGMLASINI